MSKTNIIPIVISIISILVFYIVSRTIGSVLLFIPGIIISYFICLKIYGKKQPNPSRLLPFYILALAVQLIHFLEEYLTGFISKLPELFGLSPYPLDYWISFNMIAYSIFILGAIAIFKKRNEFMIIPIFFILVGVVFNGIAHTLLAVYAGEYFPGLYTAIIYLVLGPILLKRIFILEK